MASVLQIVDPEDASVVLFDLNGANPDANGSVTCAILHDPDFGSPALQSTRVEAPALDVGDTTFHRRALAQMSLRVRMQATTYANLATGVGRLAQFLSQGCVMKWTANGSTDVRYIDVEPSPTPALIDGRELALHKVSVLFDSPEGVPLVIQRQPYLRGEGLTPSVNLLTNSTLLRDSDGDGTPDGWTSAAGTDSIDTASEAYSVTHNAAVDLAYQQATVSGGTAVAGSIEAWRASGDRTLVLKLVSQPGGATIGTTNITASTPARYTVTGTTTGGDTGCRLVMAYSGGSASTVSKWRNAQLETGPSATAYRVKAETVLVEPDATGFARLLPIYNPGSASAPCSIQVAFPDAAISVVEALMALRSSDAITGKLRLADYLNGPHYAAGAATGNGWTVTLGTDTSSVAGSGSAFTNVARISHSTTPTTMTKRVTWTRTTLLDSLRGKFDVYARVKAAGVKKHRLQLRWAPGNATPASYVNEEVIHDTNETTAGGTWVTVNLGRISIPPEHSVTLGTIKLELWSRVGAGSGTNLDVDYLSLVPAQSAVVSAPEGARTLYTGADLVSPLTNPAGGTAMTVADELAYFTASTANGGTPTLSETGHHRVRFRVGSGSNIDRTVLLRIRNTSASSDVKTRTVNVPGNSNRITRFINFDAAAATNYEAQVDDPSGVTTSSTERNIFVRNITDIFIPAIAQNQQVRSDPGSRPSRYNVEKLDSSGNVLGEWDSTTVPFWVPPGLSLLYVESWDAPGAGYEEAESVVTRTMTVTPTIYPRWWA